MKFYDEDEDEDEDEREGYGLVNIFLGKLSSIIVLSVVKTQDS